MKNIKKRYSIPAIALVVIFILLFFLSSIVKSYINKNSEELSGRKMVINDISLNYLKLKLTLDGFSMYEENKEDTFVSFSKLIINFEPWKLVRKEFAFSQIELSNPYINIEQDGETFNFSSLIPETDTTVIEQDAIPEDTTDSELKYSIKDFKLISGKFKYYDKSIDNQLEFDNLNLNLPEFAWNSQSSNMGVEFSIGDEGVVKINSTVSERLAKYKVNFETENIQLSAFTNYLKEFVNISDFKGLLQTNIEIKGSLKETNNIAINGNIKVDSLLIIDGMDNELVSAASINTTLDDIDLAKNSFSIGGIEINDPIISATLGKQMSNFEYFVAPSMVEPDSTIATTPEDTLSIDSTQTSEMYFNLSKLTVNNGHIIFTDSTLNRSFKYNIKDIDILVSDINLQNTEIPLEYSMKFHNRGAYEGTAVINPQEPHDLSYSGKVSKLDLHSFSPYTEYYLGYPINSGLFNYDCQVEMTPNELNNENKVLVEEIEFGKSTKDTTAAKVPLKLAMVILKDANDNVEMDVPVTGNPSEPGFKLGKIIWKTFAKFMVKAAASPFGALGKMIGTTADELETIPFSYTQDSLNIKQRETLDKIAQILAKKPDLVFSFRQDLSMDDEILLLAEKQVKTTYISDKLNSSKIDWTDINNDDETFNSYLLKMSPETDSLSVSERFVILSDKNKLKSDFDALYKHRNDVILSYLTETKQCLPENINIQNADFENMPHELKNPSFKVVVSVK